ncbi:MAG: DUF5684 domain-containing protein [Atribacterota bacterium]
MEVIPTLIQIVIIILVIAAFWVIFEKAGYPGWGAIIPIYNIYLMVKVADRPGWWTILYFVPLVNIIISIIVDIDIAKNFGRSVLFGIGLFFLTFIFAPIIAFSDDDYLLFEDLNEETPPQNISV